MPTVRSTARGYTLGAILGSAPGYGQENGLVESRMRLTHLALQHFRNYERLSLDLGPGVTVFHGDNGQGKTNLLEAIYFLATTRSPRSGSDRELISLAERSEPIAFARLEARVQREDGELHVEMLLRLAPTEASANGRGPSSHIVKTIRVNGLPSRAAQLVGQVNVVYFAPEDVALVSGAPSGRRRYLDITNSQVSPIYLRTLQRYQRVLLQRNTLLRQVRERRQPRELLDFWTGELATNGSFVVAQRLRMLGAIDDVARHTYRALSGTDQRLSIRYETTLRDPIEEGEEWESDLQARFRTKLAQLQPREIEAGMTLIGPHRDDFSFEVDGVDVGVYGSRGQQRLAVLALKLAETRFLATETAEIPILLLDDVLSELDSRRRRFVLAQVAAGGQSLATTTDLEDFPPEFLSRAQVLFVRNGRVEARSPA
jgi:DNA replication and repair protein RecF